MLGKIKEIFKNQRGFKTIVIVVFMAFVLIGTAFWGLNYELAHQQPAGSQLKISLAATKADLNGIEKGSVFLVKANQALSADQLKSNLKFEPALDFSVKKSQPSFLTQVRNFLSANASTTLGNEYVVTPQGELNQGVVYKIETATSTDLSLDHDYSWAFKVKDNFTISDSLPNDKSTGVPVKTGIEITFNRLEIGQNADQYFAIEPTIPGKFEVGINKITFIPTGDLKAKTLYKVTIKKGYQSGEKAETLAEDKVIVFETANQDAETVVPYASFNSDYSEMTPEKAGFLEASGNASSSELTVYKYENTTGFLADYYRFENRGNTWSSYNSDIFTPSTSTQEAFKFQANLLKQDENNNYGLIELPKKLEAGSYVFRITAGDSVNYSFARVSPLAYYYSEINGDGLVWAYDFANKKPFSNVKAYFVDKIGGEKELGTTDANGLVKFDSSSVKDDNSNTSLVFRSNTLGETGVPEVGRVIEKRKNYFQGYLNTDRYAYRLTDKVHFWGVVKGRSLDLREKKVKVSLDGLVEKEVTVSPFDTIEGELAFEGLQSGYHNLTVTYNDETITQSSIEVFSFQKPLYKIDVTTDRSFATTDSPVKANIKVSFFDGTPVANMELATEINWQDTVHGSVTTNAKGEAELSYIPKYYFTQSSDQYSDSWTSYPMSLRFIVKPALSEEGEIWGEADLNIYGPKITMQAAEADKGNSILFTAKVNQLNLATSTEDGIIGQAVANQAVKVQIVKFSYIQIPDGEQYDPIEKIKVKKYRYEPKREILKEASGQTDPKGEWTVAVDKKAVDNFSYLKAIFSAQDDTGKTVMSSAESYNYYQNTDYTALNLTNLDSDLRNISAYKLGEQIHLKQSLTGPTLPVDSRTLIINYQEGLRGSSIISQDTFTDTFDEKHLPSMTYLAVKVMPNGFLESNSITASFDEEVNRLKVDITTDKASYKPREEINLSINIKDQANKGVKAVANVATVDEALFNITPWGYGGDILASLYTDIYAYPNSLSTSYVTNFKNGAEKGGCFAAGTKIKMNDGTEKNIETIRVGDEIATFANDQSATLAESIVQGVSSHEVQGYLLINNQLKVTPEHKLYLNGSWQLAGAAKLGDYLVNDLRQSGVIKELKYVKSKNVRVYNIIVGKYHTYFANGLYVHNAEKGGGGDARNFFEDTPLYKQFESDDNGSIKASFKAPDNLTSWRVSVNAYNQAGFKAGSSDKLVPVGLPLFVDAIVAPEYLTGDNPIIKLRAFGTAYQAGQPVTFKLKSETLKLDFSTTTLASEINIPLGKLPLGKHTLTASVSQGELKDSLEKPFQVFDNYVRSYKSDSQAVVDGPVSLKANVGSFTDLLFVDDGKGKYYDQLLGLNWQSSIRSDIQSAAYLAAKTLNDNFYGGKENFYANLDLSSYQHGTNMAITLFPYGSDNYALTAELADAVPEVLDNGAILQGLNAKLNDKDANFLEVSQIMYGLSALGQPDLPFINYLKTNASTTPEAKLYLALALYKAGDSEGARAIYADEILPLLKQTNETAYLEFSKDPTVNAKSTAALGLLASDLEKAPNNELVNKILVNLRKFPLKDNSTALEEAMIVKNEIAKVNPVEASFSYQTSSRKGTADLSKGQTFGLTLSEAELKTLIISEVKGSPRAISYYEQAANPADLAKTNLISVKKTYWVDGKETINLKEGDLVEIRLDPQLSNEAPDDNYQVVDYLPAGLKPIVQTYNLDVQADNGCNPIWYPVKQTDEAVYFNIGKWFTKTTSCQHRTINYHARVASKGEFRAQGTVIQSMNNLDLTNISAETNLLVK